MDGLALHLAHYQLSEATPLCQGQGQRRLWWEAQSGPITLCRPRGAAHRGDGDSRLPCGSVQVSGTEVTSEGTSGPCPPPLPGTRPPGPHWREEAQTRLPRLVRFTLGKINKVFRAGIAEISYYNNAGVTTPPESRVTGGSKSARRPGPASTQRPLRRGVASQASLCPRATGDSQPGAPNRKLGWGTQKKKHQKVGVKKAGWQQPPPCPQVWVVVWRRRPSRRSAVSRARPHGAPSRRRQFQLGGHTAPPEPRVPSAEEQC